MRPTTNYWNTWTFQAFTGQTQKTRQPMQSPTWNPTTITLRSLINSQLQHFLFNISHTGLLFEAGLIRSNPITHQTSPPTSRPQAQGITPRLCSLGPSLASSGVTAEGKRGDKRGKIAQQINSWGFLVSVYRAHVVSHTVHPGSPEQLWEWCPVKGKWVETTTRKQ